MAHRDAGPRVQGAMSSFIKTIPREMISYSVHILKAVLSLIDYFVVHFILGRPVSAMIS